MQKLLISIFPVLLLLNACSSQPGQDSGLTHFASNLSLMYRAPVQQGNVIEQETIDQLKPGMSKRQVRYLLGTPALIDSFHQNRWDYIYTLKEDGIEKEAKQFTLLFKDDRLVRIEGDYRPHPVDAMTLADKKEKVVDVPDYVPQNKGFITRILESLGILSENDS